MRNPSPSGAACQLPQPIIVVFAAIMFIAATNATPDRDHLLDSISSFLSYYKNSPELVDPNLIFGTLIVKGKIKF
ncbi:Hypothetical protein NTJ_11336 [Nesidiocoris tenuis]|uniref:Uncharacterized protein n=1 Tax=Nesidiocoris tenuis TaxID=355587 RepID=A0ABN7B5T9_9HEMI|nr:Hypothetical protein NTJ_11336 [Nesidiocoris tenuis]